MTNRLQSSGIAALSFTLSAAVLALALTPAVATAAQVEEIRLTAPSDYIVETRRVGTSDLDLTSAADLKTLNGRISRAANQVCRDPGTNRVTLESGFCAYNARRDASEQVAALRSSALMASAANAVSAPGSITIVASR